MSVTMGSPRVGELLRSWRQRRSLSQLELSLESEVSARHLSFIETGRARPSREMVLHLAERLDVPLRERNSLLLAAGFAPLYGERLSGGGRRPALDAGIGQRRARPHARRRRGAICSSHPPTPCASPSTPTAWRPGSSISTSGELEALYHELAGYPGVTSESPHEEYSASAIVLPLRLRHGEGELAFFGTVTTFGTPLDVTLSEIAVEAFYPASAATANALLGEVGAGSGAAVVANEIAEATGGPYTRDELAEAHEWLRSSRR
jgi:transcriptional regulator with XRE-family HTH domain